jgi:hypothetical protein
VKTLPLQGSIYREIKGNGKEGSADGGGNFIKFPQQAEVKKLGKSGLWDKRKSSNLIV